MALERLDSRAIGYLEGGAGSEWTQRENEAAFTRWRFRPRVLSGHATADTSVELLGHRLAAPIIVAPFGNDAMFHPEGHRAVVRGAGRAGTLAIVSSTSSTLLEDVRAADPAAAIFTVTAMGEPEVVIRVGRRAAAAGYEALCFTLDTPRVGWREGMQLPTRATSLSPNYGPEDWAARLAPVGWTWSTVTDVCSDVGLPWLAKGVLIAEDAGEALRAGAAGVIVSNHGGRQLDGAPAALDALPEIVDAVAGRVPVLMDGGIRRGTDVLKALALGAAAVGVGRPVIWGLAAGGEDGVASVLDLLRQELENALVLAGRPDISSVDASLVERHGG